MVTRGIHRLGSQTPIRADPRPQAGVHWPCFTVTLLVLAIAASGVRGADYPAQMLRALVWDRSGGSIWNSYWYGGHLTAGYSVLAPGVMALVGPFTLAAGSSILATYYFSRLTTSLLATPSTALANHAFAIAAAVSVVVGQATFAFGLALALCALWAWYRSRVALAVCAASVTALASPVAASFLAIATTAVVFDRLRDRRSWSTVDRARTSQGIAMTLATTAPVALLIVVFPSPGRFPFRVEHFVQSVLVALLLAAVVRVPAVRIAAGLSIAAAVVLFLVPNPLGGNFVRLTQFGSVPLCVTAIHSVRRALVVPFAALLVVGLGWTVQSGVVSAATWWGEESAAADYYRPLVDEVRRRNVDGRPLGRLEIPFTDNHWESYYVAPEVPFARGWERQLDLARNEVLYEQDLTATEYRRWLLDNAVRWIALADVDLDEGGRAERFLVDHEGTAGDAGWLRLVWQNDHWRLYELVDYRPIVDPPVELVRQGPDSFVLRSDRPANVTVRFAYASEMTISGAACIEPDEGGWIIARLPASGEFEVHVDLTAALLGTESDRCG